MDDKHLIEDVSCFLTPLSGPSVSVKANELLLSLDFSFEYFVQSDKK